MQNGDLNGHYTFLPNVYFPKMNEKCDVVVMVKLHVHWDIIFLL